VDGGLLSLSKIGRISIRLHRPLAGTPKTVTISREADGWYACISCADVPAQPLSPTSQETGIDVGLKVFLVTAEGVVFENPRHYRTAERWIAKRAKRVSRRKKGSKRHKKAGALLAKVHQTMTPFISKICGLPTWCGTITSPRASVMRTGRRSLLSSTPRQHGPDVR
jgi:putative transposase